MRKGNDTCWVVSTGMKNDDGSARSRFQILDESSEIQAILLGIIVSVLPDILEASILEDESMVSPCWVTVVGNI